MSAAAFELDEDSISETFPMKLAVSAAAVATDARLIAVERNGSKLRLTFDKDISQTLIVDMLELILSAGARA